VLPALHWAKLGSGQPFHHPHHHFPVTPLGRAPAAPGSALRAAQTGRKPGTPTPDPGTTPTPRLLPQPPLDASFAPAPTSACPHRLQRRKPRGSDAGWAPTPGGLRRRVGSDAGQTPKGLSSPTRPPQAPPPRFHTGTGGTGGSATPPDGGWKPRHRGDVGPGRRQRHSVQPRALFQPRALPGTAFPGTGTALTTLGTLKELPVSFGREAAQPQVKFKPNGKKKKMGKRNLSSCLTAIAGEPRRGRMESYANYILQTTHSVHFPINYTIQKPLLCPTSRREGRRSRTEQPGSSCEARRGPERVCGSLAACSAGEGCEPARSLGPQSPEDCGACSSPGQNSSRSRGGWSMPKNEEGFPCTSRSLFTKAVNEETQFPMK